MICHAHESGDVHRVVPGGDLTLGVEVPKFVRRLRVPPRNVLPLDLVVFIENVHPLFTHL
jgi:hypothetical protein